MILDFDVQRLRRRGSSVLDVKAPIMCYIKEPRLTRNDWHMADATSHNAGLFWVYMMAHKKMATIVVIPVERGVILHIAKEKQSVEHIIWEG